MPAGGTTSSLTVNSALKRRRCPRHPAPAACLRETKFRKINDGFTRRNPRAA